MSIDAPRPASRARPVTIIAAVLVGSLIAAVPAQARTKDRNRNHIPDRWERSHHLPVSSNQARRDPDRDGLNNLAEYRSKTNPRRKDTDRDGVSDAGEDRDHDKVDNGNEVRERTRPDKRDTNGNGKPDGSEDADRDRLSNAGEDASGNDPIDRDTDGDGIKDGDENAGIITSFQRGVLTIKLFNKRTISGLVTEETDLWCDSTDGFASDSDEGDYEDPDPADDELDNDPEDEGADDGYADDESYGQLSANDDFEDDPGGGSDDESCELDVLSPGAVVHGALLESGPGSTFVELEIVRGD